MTTCKTACTLCALLLAAACGKEEFAVPPPAGGAPQEIRFEIAIATAAATPCGASTRVATNTDFTSSFTAGDRVGLFIVKGDGALQSAGNWVDNAPMTFDGTTWTCDLPAGKDVYPKDGKPLSFYAYYPYRPEGVDPLAMPFTVQTDQSTTGLSASYLLTASTPNVDKTADPVSLTFRHKLALVRVKLADGPADKDKAPRPADVVTLKGRQPSATLNLATGDVATSGAATDIRMHYNSAEKCWYALVPQQNVPQGSVLLTFEWTYLTTLSHRPSRSFNLIRSEVKPLDLTIDVNLTVDPNHVYKVGDIYPYVGFSGKKGVVFEVSNGGKSGKIVGLRRMEGVLVWSTELVFTNISDDDNGRVNMEGFRKRDGKFEKYPAMKWVDGLNRQGTTYGAQSTGVWYLPALNEMRAVCSEQNREILTPVLKELGIENPFPEYKFAWTSTDWTNINVATVHLENGLGMALSKDDAVTNCTWPVMAF